MNTMLLVLLQDAAGAQSATPQSPSMMPTIIMLVVMFAIVYFFMIRPQNKKQKEIQRFRASLQTGQEVVTIGGIHGTIKSIDDSTGTIVLKVGLGTEITFEKSAIAPPASAPRR